MGMNAGSLSFIPCQHQLSFRGVESRFKLTDACRGEKGKSHHAFFARRDGWDNGVSKLKPADPGGQVVAQLHPGQDQVEGPAGETEMS